MSQASQTRPPGLAPAGGEAAPHPLLSCRLGRVRVLGHRWGWGLCQGEQVTPLPQVDKPELSNGSVLFRTFVIDLSPLHPLFLPPTSSPPFLIPGPFQDSPSQLPAPQNPKIRLYNAEQVLSWEPVSLSREEGPVVYQVQFK